MLHCSQVCGEASGHSKGKRSGKLLQAIEHTAAVRLLLGVFDTGKLLPLDMVSYCGDEEYLSACLRVAQDLGRYCVSRACEV